MSKVLDLRKIASSSSNRDTIIINAILCNKYPDLVKNGSFDYDYIPITKQITEIISKVISLQDLFYDIEPSDKNVQSLLDKIIILYDPVVQRAKIKKDKIQKYEKQVKEFTEEKVKPHLKQISEALESCLKILEGIDIHLISDNLNVCDENIISYQFTAERLINSSIQLKNKVDTIIN